LVTIAFVLSSGFSQSKNRINTETIIQGLKQPTLPTSVISINETNSLNSTNSYYSSTPPKKDLVSLDTLNSTVYDYPDMSGFFFLPPDKTQQGQITGSDLSLQTNVTNINASVPISLDSSEFVTYTYGGYPIQQPNSTHFIFSFPDNIGQGQVAGSDALAWSFYAIQKLDFDAAFFAPKVSALGFDEMAIFATSNTITYKGTEFCIRMDLEDGLICGYVQEPNGNNGEVNFRMINLLSNDGVIHHYNLVMLGTGVSFCIDGIQYGFLNFPSNTDYSSLGFSICAVVHRFTDGWDSSGDNMITGNFNLNEL
jgi:hypothetical protein